MNLSTLNKLCLTFFAMAVLEGIFPIGTSIAQEPLTPEVSKLQYLGSSTIGNFIKDAEQAYSKAIFEIDTEPESAGGEQAILEGRTDLAGVANVPSATTLSKGVISSLIGWDAIAIIVHPSNPVKNLTTSQLRGIFTGAIKNWKEVGGPDLPVRTFITGIESATHKVCRSVILGESEYKDCEMISPDIDILGQIETNPGAIGHISYSFLKQGRKVDVVSVNGQKLTLTNSNYPITRPLYLLWWPGRQEVAGFVNWALSAEGQRIVMKRFIGAREGIITVGTEPKGKLIVMTQTYPVEDGGTFYYPHQPYEIYSADQKLVMRVPNHLTPNDENPTPISLPPGSYFIRPESRDGKSKEIFTVIEANKLTRINASLGSQSSDVFVAEKNEGRKPGIDTKIHFNGDFRFRVEQDWNSRKSNGSYRDDRSRMRYRMRVGFAKNLDKHFSIGARIRTGKLDDQQGPHLTIGGNTAEFGLAQIGFEKAYVKYTGKSIWGWVGKNDYPFWKQHELLWNDNVFPEGIVLGWKPKSTSSFKVEPTTAYFIFKSSNTSFDKDVYLASVQMKSSLWLNETSQIDLNIGQLFFHNMPNIPDGKQDYFVDYNILSMSLNYSFRIFGQPLSLGADTYWNLADYTENLEVPADMSDQRSACVFNLKYGKLKKRGDLIFHVYYANIEKYAVVDYLAQNDWARWDYSGYGASGARLSNFKGIEMRTGYNITDKINLIARFYSVEQLINTGAFTETGDRLRLDLNVKI